MWVRNSHRDKSHTGYWKLQVTQNSPLLTWSHTEDSHQHELSHKKKYQLPDKLRYTPIHFMVNDNDGTRSANETIVRNCVVLFCVCFFF